MLTGGIVGDTRHWNPGDEVMLRGVWKNKVWWAQSMNVVEDTDDLIIVYCRAGNPQMRTKERITPAEFLSIKDLELVASTWVRTNVLMLTKPSEMYSIYVMWDAFQWCGPSPLNSMSVSGACLIHVDTREI